MEKNLHFYLLNSNTLQKISFAAIKKIALALTCLVYCNLNAIEAEKIRKDAEQLSSIGKAENAIPLYKELLNANPSPEEKRLIKLDLARAYFITKQYSLALNEYEELLVENPKDCQVKKELGDIYLSFARYDAKNFKHNSALNWYVAVISLDPHMRDKLLWEYAEEVSRSGNGPDAIILYKEALIRGGLSPADTRLANLGLAQTYVWVGNYEEALKIYDELLKINPRDKEVKKGKSQVYINYARYDAVNGNHKQAIDAFKKAIELNPDEKGKYLKELADQLKLNSQEDDAIAVYKEILESKPGGDYEREIRLSLARVYIEKFNYDEALKIYGDLLEQNKYDALAKQGKAKVYIDYANYNARIGKHRDAIEWYYKAIENDPIMRPELLYKIADEQEVLGGKDVIPLSEQDLQYEACSDNEFNKNEPDIKEYNLGNSNPPVKAPVDEAKKIAPYQAPLEIPTLNDASHQQVEEQRDILQAPVNYQFCPEPQNPISAKETAKIAFNDAVEQAKYLRVFDANRAFEASLAGDPDNRNYRESYAWHLQTFSFRAEALVQQEILVPCESDQTSYFEALGWNYRLLGKLDESIWAFSNIYDIPCSLTRNYQLLLAGKFYRYSYLDKIHDLWGSLVCMNDNEDLEVKKKSSSHTPILASLMQQPCLPMKS